MTNVALPPIIAQDRSGWPWNSVDQASNFDDSLPWPKITVVTPSFNQGRYLEETILSVIQQGYPSLEYIIMDGGSNDSSASIIRHYAEHLTHWQSRPDGGQADAINNGFAIATGDILAWLNSDDTYLPGTLAMIGRLFQQYPDALLAYGEGWYVNEASQRLEPCRFVRRSISDTYIANRDPVLQPAAFWRHSLWDSVGPLNTNLHWVFDWEWFIRAHKCTSFQYIPEALATYRIHPEAKTRSGSHARQLEHARVTRRYGGWWHPNHLVQQARRFEHGANVLTRSWPGVLSAPVRALAAGPRVLAERVLHGTYMP